MFLAICKLLKLVWPGTESNRRRRPFQGRALPTELPGQVGKRMRSIGTDRNNCQLHPIRTFSVQPQCPLCLSWLIDFLRILPTTEALRNPNVAQRKQFYAPNRGYFQTKSVGEAVVG